MRLKSSGLESLLFSCSFAFPNEAPPVKGLQDRIFEMGFQSYTAIEKEYNLIMQKSSTRPASQRKIIVNYWESLKNKNK